MLDHVPAGPSGEFAMADEPLEVQRHAPQFSGRAGEFFGIWFVNLILSLLTLGIYSAWAKVRTERYFYGNTRLAGATFEYLADPIAILKGRLIAYAVVIALALSARFSFGTYFALLLVIGLLVPAIIVLGLRFRARNSAWRGLTFRFDEGIGAAYGPFMGWPMLSALSLSLLYPVMKRRQQEFLVQGHRFGGKRFGFGGDVGAYYVPYAIAVGIGFVLFGAMIGGMIATSGLSGGTTPPGAGASVAIFATVAGFYAGVFALTIFLRVRYTNLMWDNTSLGAHRFESTLRARDMLWIYASNAVAILCTIGLAVPWAMIRLARYRAAHFAVLATGSLEAFVAEAKGEHSATGAELVDALDLGLDFGG